MFRFIQLLMLFLSLTISNIWAKSEKIPLSNIRIPSNDLYMPGHGLLSAEEAWALSKDVSSPLDLSRLNPPESVLWKNEEPKLLDTKLDKIDLDENNKVKFEGELASQSTVFRFNISPLDGNQDGYFIAMLDKRLHTTLLRRNLLRKLGHKIPAMKYLKNLEVYFENLDEKNNFLKKLIPENTLGAPERWVVKGLKDDSLSITINDLVIMTPKQGDHYNLAMGVPPKTLLSRTLRSLIVPYALVDVAESINKLNWQVGRIDNDYLVLPHFSVANFNATLDDVKWSLRRLEKLNRKDFEEIVKLSHYPLAVEKLIIEKLIARRNSLLKLVFKNQNKINFNATISHGEELKEGRLTKEDWDGYASRFAHGAPDSPFQDFGYYIFTEFQTEIIDELIRRVNENLEGFDRADAQLEYYQDEFRRGLDHFVETGEFLEQEVGTWVSPIVNGSLILSRDIVIGRHSGNDNLVQLADTFGYSLKVGAHMGFEGLGEGYGAFARADVRYIKTFTHLKPVKTLKQSVKEPYKNMIVPFLKKNLKKKFGELSNLEEASEEDVDNLMDEINKSLGVGESLVITEKIGPNVIVQGSYTIANTRLSLAADSKGILVKRIHLYRKSADQLQIYIDNGKSMSMGLSFSVGLFIPVTKLQGRGTKGKYNIDVYNVNIKPDLEDNPKLLEKAKALEYLLDEGSAELLKVQQKPYSLENKFKDKSTKFAFLNWRSKKIKKAGEMSIKGPNGRVSEFLKITSDKNSGFNNRAFVTDIVNYYLGKLYSGVSLGSNTWQNPGQTYKGKSRSRLVKFEAQKSKNQLKNKFMSLTHRREGWDISRESLDSLVRAINKKYGNPLFDEMSLQDATGLKLYSVDLNVNLYEKAVNNLVNLKKSEIEDLKSKYLHRNRNKSKCRDPKTPNQKLECGDISSLYNGKKRCKNKLDKGNKKKAYACFLEVFWKLEKHLDFFDLKNILGPKNIFVQATINGFREDSEILNAPIQSNTIGKIASRFPYGPVEMVRNIIGMSGGEFDGSWLRENL